MAGGNNKNKNKQAKAVKKVIPNFWFLFFLLWVYSLISKHTNKKMSW